MQWLKSTDKLEGNENANTGQLTCTHLNLVYRKGKKDTREITEAI